MTQWIRAIKHNSIDGGKSYIAKFNYQHHTQRATLMLLLLNFLATELQ